MDERYHISQQHMTAGLDNPYTLFKLLLSILMFCVGVLLMLEFTFMEKQNFTMKLDSINIPYEGEVTYTFNRDYDTVILNECVDAVPGERVLFTDYRGSVTRKVWKTEVHDEFKCSQ